MFPNLEQTINTEFGGQLEDLNWKLYWQAYKLNHFLYKQNWFLQYIQYTVKTLVLLIILKIFNLFLNLN